jgi:asparagine synthase (glutamine-hydrolysing)
MCGIAAKICHSGQIASREELRVVGESLKHRGPDDVGVASFQIAGANVALVHTRLSIIDLSRSGNQPFESADGKWRLIYNGEIYNYVELRKELESLGAVFTTDSDTEVLLWAWRTWSHNSLEKLRGMFAFIVVDLERKKLTAVRDAFGIKPLYYQRTNTNLAFASEIPALQKMLLHRSSLNNQVAYEFLRTGSYDNTDQTFFRDVNSVPPGHFMELDLGDSNNNSFPVRWFQSPESTEHFQDFSDASFAVRTALEHSVRIHLRSDAPLGVALSGGLDSSVLTALVRRLEPDADIQTFSFVSRGSSSDESHWSNLVSNHLRTNHHEVSPASHQIVNDIEDVVSSQGEPFGSLSSYAQFAVYREAHSQGLKVILDGQGGDEVFGGYFGYLEFRLRSLLSNGDLSAAFHLIRSWSIYPRHKVSQALMALLGTYLAGNSRAFALQLAGRARAPEWVLEEKLLDSGVTTRSGQTYGYPLVREVTSRELAKRLSIAMFSGEMVNLLRHSDRSSMRWSVESRVPYLDLDVVSLAQSLPEQYLLSPTGETKSILRHSMKDLLPAEVLFRRDKVGFEAPDLLWLRQMSNRANVLTEGLEKIPWIDKRVVDQKLQEVLDGKLPYSNVFWRLVNLAKWNKLFS